LDEPTIKTAPQTGSHRPHPAILLPAVVCAFLVFGGTHAAGQGFPTGPLEHMAAADLAGVTSTNKAVRLEAIVLFQSRPNRIYCSDDTGPVRVILKAPETFQPGDRVEITGVASLSEGRTWLHTATARKLGTAPLPAPVETGLGEMVARNLDGRRVTIEGRVLGHEKTSMAGGVRETVIVESDSAAGGFLVRFPDGTGSRERFPAGSLLRATGLGILEHQAAGLISASIYPASLEDTAVLLHPFWTGRRITAAVAGGGGAALVIAVWVLLQRRQLGLLRDSEERLRALSEHSFDSTFVLDAEGSVKFMTPAARRFLGDAAPAEASTREGFSKAVHPDDLPRITSVLATVVAKPGRSERISGYRIRMPDGSIRWAESIITNGLHVPGVDGVVVNIHDITEQTLAFQGLERAAELQRSLNEFAASISPLNDEREVLWEVCRRCISRLGFTDCVIYLLEPDRNVLVQVAAFGPKSPAGTTILDPIEIPVGRGIVGAAAASGRTEIVPDTRQDPRYIVDDALRLSEIAVPIVAEEVVLGVIDSEHPEAGFFTPEHASLLGSIAFLCANKLVRARTDRRLKELNRDLERRIAERTSELQGANDQLIREIAERTRTEAVQRALFEISEAVHAAEDLQQLYERIHAIIGTLMPAGNFYIAVYDTDADIVSFPYHRDEFDPPPPSRKSRRGMTEYVLRTGRATLADLGKIESLKEAGEYDQTGHPAAIWLGVPLQTQGRTFGVMAVQDHQDANAFGEEDKRILNFIAGQTALAIERKRSQEQLRERTRRLRESEDRFRRAFGAIPSNVSLVRLSDQTFVEVNDAVVTFSGFSREEIIGKSTLDLGIWPDTSQRDEFFRRLKTEGRVRPMEVTLRAKNGRLDTVLIAAEQLEFESEPHILAISVVINERKQAEEELVRSLARERELSRLKSEFVSLVSHEFRTPIGIIHSSAEILERYLDRLPESERMEHLRAIQTHAWRMASLMEEVLVFGRVEAGKLDFEAGDFDLAEVCGRWIDEISQASHSRCPIAYSAEGIPRKAYGDPDLLRHILSNLLSNAVKYSPLGAEVSVAVMRDGRDAVFRVADRGAGIPKADLDQLFTAFHRGGNVRHLPGTGLGLAIIRRCLDLHRGTIHIESVEGRGTVVTVRVPLFREQP
jgi:PAS domain S-box-containing protein